MVKRVRYKQKSDIDCLPIKYILRGSVQLERLMTSKIKPYNVAQPTKTEKFHVQNTPSSPPLQN